VTVELAFAAMYDGDPLRRAVLALIVVGCGSSSSPPETPAPVEPPARACVPGELTLEGGGCQAAGVDTCGEGFAPDERRSCTAILPAEACGKGQTAALGETTCREVAPCADGAWGDIPIEPGTQHVDASYVGGGSDGSAAKPWTTIKQAFTAATPGALVAVAAGSYHEELILQGKPVRLWGRCPRLVEIVGTSAQLGLQVITGASGTELHGVAVTGSQAGIIITGARDVVVDRVWIHDTIKNGFDVEDARGSTSARLGRSLVERAGQYAVYVGGSEVTIEGSVFRDTQSLADGAEGRGAAFVSGLGRRRRASVTVSSSVFERNRGLGVLIGESDVTLDRVVVRDTLAGATGDGGRGVEVQANGAGRASNVVVRSSLFERNREIGVHVSGSTLSMERTVIRHTLPTDSQRLLGRAMNVIPDLVSRARANVTIRASVLEENHEVGLFIVGSDAFVEATIVRDTQPQVSDGFFGRGIGLSSYPAFGERAKATIRGSAVERTFDLGVFAIDSDVTLEASYVTGTKSRSADGAFGDALAIQSVTLPASGVVTASRFEGSARAGIANFGGHVSLAESKISCNVIDLDGETSSMGGEYTFDDLGGNGCGCETSSPRCIVLTSRLEPPSPMR
jgi:hypothetical protein